MRLSRQCGERLTRTGPPHKRRSAAESGLKSRSHVPSKLAHFTPTPEWSALVPHCARPTRVVRSIRFEGWKRCVNPSHQGLFHKRLCWP